MEGVRSSKLVLCLWCGRRRSTSCVCFRQGLSSGTPLLPQSRVFWLQTLLFTTAAAFFFIIRALLLLKRQLFVVCVRGIRALLAQSRYMSRCNICYVSRDGKDTYASLTCFENGSEAISKRRLPLDDVER